MCQSQLNTTLKRGVSCTNSSKTEYPEDLSIDIQCINGDLHISGYGLPSFLKLSFLESDVQIVPHLPYAKADK